MIRLERNSVDILLTVCSIVDMNSVSNGKSEGAVDMSPLQYALSKYPIIISLTDPKDLDKALAGETGIIFLISADICTLDGIVNQIRETDKLVFVHIDLMKGLKRDASSIQYLADNIGIDGIVTTHPNLISVARRLNLLTVQRMFILDSASIEQGVKSVAESRPDAVEILPGIVVPHIHERLESNIRQMIIAGGLINTEDEIISILKNGAAGVSTSATDLWNSASGIKRRLRTSIKEIEHPYMN